MDTIQLKKPLVLIIAGVLFFISTGASYAIFSATNTAAESDYTPPVAKETDTEEDKGPKTEECPLNGALYSKERKAEWEKRRPLGIMVENSTDARPQSGLSSADVIYETVAESGITRFLTVFYCQDAKYVGPVRSARIYFVKIIQGYGNNPLYTHVGGANVSGPTDALGEISELGWRLYNDMDMLSGLGYPQIWRDNERLPGVATEHTVYTNTEKLWNLAKEERNLTNKDKKGVAWNEDFESWTFKDAAKDDKKGDITSIKYGFWEGPSYASDYNVTWTYDPETNTYLRDNGAKPHMDKNTDEQLAPSNVVVVFAAETRTGNEKGHLMYDIIGGGDALIFQDGNVIEASWEKVDEESMIRYYDETGEEVSLVRGQVWTSILDVGNEVAYDEGGSDDSEPSDADTEDTEEES